MGTDRVQDGGVVGDTKRSVGLGTADPPLQLLVPDVLLFVREAQPTEIWDSTIWRQGVGHENISAVAVERQSVALICPSASGSAIRVWKTRINATVASFFEIREGPLGEFISVNSTDWADFNRTGDPTALTDGLSKVGVVTNSQIRETMRVVAGGSDITDTPFVIHPGQALIINPGADNVTFEASWWFEQFRSSQQF